MSGERTDSGSVRFRSVRWRAVPGKTGDRHEFVNEWEAGKVVTSCLVAHDEVRRSVV